MRKREVWVIESLMNKKTGRWEPVWGDFYFSRQTAIRALRSAGVYKDNSFYRPALYVANKVE
jgi:GH15 family glucan-1,4-alpha-glucosidase